MSQRPLNYSELIRIPQHVWDRIGGKIARDVQEHRPVGDLDDVETAVDEWLAKQGQPSAVEPPLVRTGQGEFTHEWTPEPRAFVDRRTAIVGAVMILAGAALAFLLLASLP